MSFWQKPIMGATLNQARKGAIIASISKEFVEKLQPQSYVAEDTWEAIVLAMERSQSMLGKMHEPRDGASTPREGDIKFIQLSHVLGAKAYSAANMRSLLLKAKGLFSYTRGCLILQQILGSLLQKAKDSSSCLTCQRAKAHSAVNLESLLQSAQSINMKLQHHVSSTKAWCVAWFKKAWRRRVMK